MKSRIFLLFAIVAIVGCKNKVAPEDISKINGYWEIEKVVLPSGETKDYTINTTIDFIKLDEKTGFRKKIMPQVDGTFLESGPAEELTVGIGEDGKVMLFYKSDYATWHEEVLSVTDSALVCKNEQKLEYHYKRPMQFSLKSDGKKAQ